MKASKFLAGMSAAALCASMLAALPAGAANPASEVKDGPAYDAEAGVFTLYDSVMDEEGKNPVKDEDGKYTAAEGSYYETALDASFVSGFKVTMVVDDATEETIQSMLNGGSEWIGGGFGYQAKNEDSAKDKNWESFGEWSIVEGVKPYAIKNVGDKTYTLEYNGEEPLFSKDDYACKIWIQCWSEANFTITDLEIFELEEQPIGNAYVSVGADSKYIVAAATSEEATGTIKLNNWEWATNDDGTQANWGHYAGLDAPDFTSDNQTAAEAWALFTEKLDEGKTPTGVTITGDANFGFGYNDVNGNWVQDKTPVLNEETGKYELVLTDICLTAPEAEAEEEANEEQADAGEEATETEEKTASFGCKFFDPSWGWVAQDGDEVTTANVTWAFNYGEEELTGSWNTFFYDAEQITDDITAQTATVFLDREFEISDTFTSDIAKVWFAAPTLVFDEPFGDSDPNDLYEVKVRCEINGDEYEIDPSIKTDDKGNIVYLWAEDTGNNSKANTARTYGGYNEWADKYIAADDLAAVESIKYYITVSEKEQPEDSSEDESVPESTPESTAESTPDNTGSNPATGTAALATVGLALAGAAFVVSKKRK
ncbi:MAG: NPXTG-anchored protein [Ruminococcus sp.]|nr:NPXTG-anchored protein [Ruminococcus sp.]